MHHYFVEIVVNFKKSLHFISEMDLKLLNVILYVHNYSIYMEKRKTS